MAIWQISCAQGTTRDFAHVFLKHDVMLIGPGAPGPFEKRLYSDVQIQHFVERPRAYDIVLMRHGKTARAVGKIPRLGLDQYAWLPCFDDVYGWNMQHARRVVWGTKGVLSLLAPLEPVFGSQKYQQRSFHRVHEPSLASLEDELRKAIPDREMLPLPEIPASLSEEALGAELFRRGLSNEVVEDVLAAIRRAARLDRWYDDAGKQAARPSEAELVAYQIAPLMLAMGWSEQLLAVEWRKVDLAFFRRTPTEPENCVMIAEAKRRGEPIEAAYAQAKKYVARLRLGRCRVIVTTDGRRILVYAKDGDSWPEQPTGYANLTALRRSHLTYPRIDAVETLVGLLPSRVGG